MPIEKFTQEHISKPYNPIIASVFYKAGLVESWGKGTVNIIDECLKVGLPAPEYRYAFGAVQVTFRKNETALKNLLERDILDKNSDGYYFQDPLFKYWIKQVCKS